MSGGQDTEFREGHSQFPATAWSLLGRLRDPMDPRVQEYLNRMIAAYWRPVYKFVRISWRKSNEDAKDLTQAFFAHVLDSGLMARADPERGNFRKLLVASLRNFLANEARSGEALKRGGGLQIVSLSDSAEEGASAGDGDPQVEFEAQWARDLLERALKKLSERVKFEVYASFRKFHLEDQAVRSIAAELKSTEAQVGHWLQEARTALRRIVTDEIREYVAEDDEIARELDLLFQGWR
jgi:RNA polymerase sigma factor (sigma-70 family)